MRDGVWKTYYPEEKIKSKGNWVQGNPDGPHIFYYEDGRVREEEYYEMGIREKTWKKFDENGDLF